MWNRKNKYNASKSTGGASKLENVIEDMIKLREKAGEFKLIAKQQHIHWYLNGVCKLGEYWPDFTVQDSITGTIFWIEAKGMETDLFRRNKRLWQAGGPGKLEIWKGSYKNPKLTDVLRPHFENALIIESQVFGKFNS